MKVSVSDMAFDPELRRKFQGVRILVNGVEHNGVIVADQEKGYIEKHKQNSDGSFALNKKGDDILTEIVKGKIELVFKESGF